MQNTNYYQTRDLYFSSYLFSKGFDLISIKSDKNSKFFWFSFNKKTECEQEEQDFLKNEVYIKAKDYSEAIKFMKRKVSEGV